MAWPARSHDRVVHCARHVLGKVRYPQPFPDHLAVEGVAAEEEIPDPAQDEALVDHTEALGVPVGAAAEVVAHHSVVGEDRQHRLLQFDLRQKLSMADIPSVGVCPEIFTVISAIFTSLL